MSKTHLFWIPFYLLGPLGRNLHSELNFPLLPILLQRYSMVVLRIPLNSNGRGVEFLSSKFLYLLDLVLEVLVLVLREHVLELVVEILLSVLEVDLESVAIQRISIGVG